MTEHDVERAASRTARGAAELDLDDDAVETLRQALPTVAAHTVDAVIAEVPGYTGALTGAMAENIQNAVQLALGGFLSLAARPRGTDPGTPLAPALEGAYALGRGEAHSGRSMDALLAAYRVGARVSWRELSGTAVRAGLDAATLAKFAELVFAYIDELSAASVAGHSDQLATTGRVRRRYLQRLGRSLLLGEPPDVLAAAAERADWEPPRTLTAVLLPSARVRNVLGSLDAATLRPEEDLPDLDDEELGSPGAASDLAVLLVPDMERTTRGVLLRTLRGVPAVVGQACPWTTVRASYLRALRAHRLIGAGSLVPAGSLVDTEDHLAELVLAADIDGLEDLRQQVLAPLADLKPGTADRLAETLRTWLLMQGRRDEVAAALHVHPQTVRYRMGQVRELYGDRLTDPDTVLALIVALATYRAGQADGD
jgi:hypothetical protein